MGVQRRAVVPDLPAVCMVTGFMPCILDRKRPTYMVIAKHLIKFDVRLTLAISEHCYLNVMRDIMCADV